MYLLMLNVKQGGIKYHFLSLWYDVNWDWTTVSRAIGEHSTNYTNAPEDIYISLDFGLLMQLTFNCIKKNISSAVLVHFLLSVICY